MDESLPEVQYEEQQDDMEFDQLQDSMNQDNSVNISGRFGLA